MHVENSTDFTKRRSIGNIIGNVFIVSLTMIILAVAINLYFAIGYVLIITVHELGHYFAAKILKLKVKFGNFTPIGAYIVHENVENCKENAIIAISGPVFGTVYSFICYIIYCFTGDATFFILSCISVTINLVNLIPVKPLDGGHVAEAISPTICYIGLPFLLYLFISAKRLKSKVISFIILVIGIYQTYDLRKRYYKESYFKIDKNIKIKFIIMYILLLLILAFSALYFYKLSNFEQLIKSIVRYQGN